MEVWFFHDSSWFLREADRYDGQGLTNLHVVFQSADFIQNMEE